MATTPKKVARPRVQAGSPAQAPQPQKETSVAVPPEAIPEAIKPAPQPQKEEPVAVKPVTDAIRVRTKHPYPVFVYRQNLTVHPGAWTLVRRDPWIETQLKAGILEQEL